MNWGMIQDQVVVILLASLPWVLFVGLVIILGVILLRNLPGIQRLFDMLTPPFVDGFLLCVSTFLTALLTGLAQEEAYKYCNPVVLFWLKLGVGCTSGSMQALVAYRNQQFAKHSADKESENKK